MRANWTVWRRSRLQCARVSGRAGVARCFVSLGVFAVLAPPAFAQCGVGGIDYSGDCVDLFWRVPTSTVFVGDVFDIELRASSANGIDQPIQAIDAILDWNAALATLLRIDKVCSGGQNDGAECFSGVDCPPIGLVDLGYCVGACDERDTDACYTCPGSYNWVASGFPNDSQLDRINADCGPDTFCSPYTGKPFNDGSALYQAIKQVVCNQQLAPAPPAPPAPASLLVTTFQFVASAPGVFQLALSDEAPCSTRQKICMRGDPPTLTDPCDVDSDCGSRTCFGGSNAGTICSDVSQCPGGVCPVLCTGCSESFCCTADDNCSSCSFGATRVLGGVFVGLDVTNIINLGGPGQVTISNCLAPTVAVGGSRYLNVNLPDGTDPVAIQVNGVSPDVLCVTDKYVGPNGVLRDTPHYATPAQWMTEMTDAFNDPTDPTIHVRGFELSSGQTYAVRLDCSEANPGTSFSDPVEGTLWLFGDTNGDGERFILDTLRVLDGFVGVFLRGACTTDADCTNEAAAFSDCNEAAGLCVWLTRENADLHGNGNASEVCGPDRDIGIIDALFALEGFNGLLDLCTVSCP